MHRHFLSGDTSLPVASWFNANGVNLDPSVPAQLAPIETNGRASFQAPETKGGSSGSERQCNPAQPGEALILR